MRELIEKSGTIKRPSGVDRLGPGLDVRGDGGYVVAPPSTVATRRYHWEFGYGLDEYPLAALPAWMGDLLAVPPVDGPVPPPRVAFASSSPAPARTAHDRRECAGSVAA